MNQVAQNNTNLLHLSMQLLKIGKLCFGSIILSELLFLELELPSSSMPSSIAKFFIWYCNLCQRRMHLDLLIMYTFCLVDRNMITSG